METAISRVVIVGGGTAGWLAACRIAASARTTLTITLIESPDIPTIGVGEGTWPTMRGTLERIGIAEADFLTACDASFKQGSSFTAWHTGAPDDQYFHPFVPPPAAEPRDLVAAWDHAPVKPFAETVCPQPALCRLNLAPRQRAMPDYGGAVNYAYHLDAVKLAGLLMRHGTERLGVRHVRDHVTSVTSADNGAIAAVDTRGNGAIAGDLFLDCTGHAAMLTGGHFAVPFIDRTSQLFNDRALAVQVPVAPDSAIASHTSATAHAAGWIWDIGLPTRRGIGCVYSSAHAGDDDAAATLEAYLRRTAPWTTLDALSPRRLTFRSGHRERFWQGNCLAIGLSAGFLEPLEASAIVLAELSIDALIDNFPATRDTMDIHARRFNELFRYRWDRIVEFLKLHYVLSQRQEPYWRDHREAASVPARLADLLHIWRDQPPSQYDFPSANEVFPAASYQYILYGMGFAPPHDSLIRTAGQGAGQDAAQRAFQQVEARARTLAAGMPTNRTYLDALRASHTPSSAYKEMMP